MGMYPAQFTPASGGCLVANTSTQLVLAGGMYVLDTSTAVALSTALASCLAQGGMLPMYRTHQQQLNVERYFFASSFTVNSYWLGLEKYDHSVSDSWYRWVPAVQRSGGLQGQLLAPWPPGAAA